MTDERLKAVDKALRDRADAFDRHGENSLEYIAADGRLLDAKEKLREEPVNGT